MIEFAVPDDTSLATCVSIVQNTMRDRLYNSRVGVGGGGGGEHL